MCLPANNNNKKKNLPPFGKTFETFPVLSIVSVNGVLLIHILANQLMGYPYLPAFKTHLVLILNGKYFQLFKWFDRNLFIRDWYSRVSTFEFPTL